MLFDVLGTFLSLLSTYYYIQLDKKAWLITLLATCVNGSLYFYKGIYANSLLECFYFLNASYGLYYWNRQEKDASFLLGRYALKHYLFLGLAFLSSFLLISLLLTTQTDSKIPMLDALSFSISIIAQWLMCQRIITTWVLWFIADALFAYMYYIHQMPFHTLLMLFFTGLAVVGYFRWSKKEKNALREAGFAVGIYP